MIGDVSSVLVLLVDDPRRLDGLLLVFFPEVISHEARSYDKIDVGDDMIEDKREMSRDVSYQLSFVSCARYMYDGGGSGLTPWWCCGMPLLTEECNYLLW